MGIVEDVESTGNCRVCDEKIRVNLQYKEDCVSWITVEPHLCQGTGLLLPECEECGACEGERCQTKSHSDAKTTHSVRLIALSKTLFALIQGSALAGK